MLEIRNQLEKFGLKIARDDGSEYALYCPFHNNTDTPAFSINKKTGLWQCFNPSCGKSGSINSLAKYLGVDGNYVRDYSIEEIEDSLHVEAEEEAENWEEAMERIAINYNSREVDKVDYLIQRGIHSTTLQHFEVGYSEKKELIVIPARDEHYQLVGFIGRRINTEIKPKYRYSKGFPRKDILFNLNNAKHYDSVIIVEGSLDAMKIHQAGFPNVVATLGANVTNEHVSLLNSYFNEIIIFHDNDEPGEAMRRRIYSQCPRKEIRLVEYESDDVKDAGDMGEAAIRNMVRNSIDFLSWSFSNFEV